MSKILAWLKIHKLVVFLSVIIFLLVTVRFDRSFSPQTLNRYEASDSLSLPVAGGGSGAYSKSMIAPVPDMAPPSESPNRLIIQNTSLSLVVTDVPKTLNQINSLAREVGGFLIDSNLSVPESAASGNISIRVPEDKLTQTLAQIRAMGVKTVSENISGTDVTDQYEDYEARLNTLRTTKSKFESILNDAVRIADILEVQREIINLQAQIDSIVGQQKYLEQSSKLARITIYLSTDEFALPYAPSESWRPEVIFKEAVRSLVKNLRQIGTAAIWLAVYSPLFIIILIGYIVWRRRSKPRL